MTTDPYADPDSGVLRNHFGVTDAGLLAQIEADITLAQLADLASRILPGSYDLSHLQSFHRQIFGSIYPWAGEIRSVGIAKTDPFCLPPHIQAFAADVFAALAKEQYLRLLPRPALSRQAGWTIDWSRLDSARNTIASAEALRGNNTGLHAMLDDLVSRDAA